ncbi:MAG TPA: molybdopterin-dependent oxidoreductase [Micromonosporaceae bacterium]
MAGLAAALGLGELIAATVDLRSSPLVAVDGVVIDRIPEGGKDFAIRLFGTNDKLALQVGTIVLLVVIVGGLGIVARARRWVGLAMFGVLGVVAIAAAVTRAGATPVWALPGLVAAGGGAALQAWLLHQLDSFEPLDGVAAGSGDWRYEDGSRRRFLWISGLAVVGGAVGGYIIRTFAQISSVEDARNQVALELPTPSGGPAPAVPGSDVVDLQYVTPNKDFYRIDTAIVPPRVDPSSWQLTIGGRVGKPLRLTFQDLLARPMVERYITLTCVSNEVGGPLIGNARWLGVPIADLLDEVDPDPEADQVVSFSVDGFTAGTPTAALRDGRDALLAVAMNGEPLPVDHGFPVRMVVPGLYGYVSATKWVSQMQLTTFGDYDAYWIPRGWAKQAPIKTESRIDRPRDGDRISAGDYVVAGVAWAQHRGISAVQVRVDGGPWQDATIANVASVDTWRLWSWHWSAPAGRHTLEVRAADNAGVFQTDRQAPPAPDGASGYHQIGLAVN